MKHREKQIKRLQARRAQFEKLDLSAKRGCREPGSMNAHKSMSIKRKR